MAERFGASFTININDLKTGLKTANSLIRESQSEFAKAASGINGDWTKSEEGVKAKLESLNKIIDVQSERVKALAENYQKRLKEGMLESSDEAIKLRTQLNNEETALQKTKNEIDNQTKAYNELKNASGEAGTEIEKSGKEAENSAKGGFTVLKGALSQLVKEGFDAAIRGAQNLATSLVEVGKKADELNTLSQQSGFTTDELQKFEYASELIDVSVDTIIGSAKRLKKNMASESKETTEAFEKLGVSVRDEAGNIRNSNDVFYEVIAALQGIDNETEKDITAMQLFGKNADELAGLIDDGGEALRKYGEEAENLGIIMSQDAVDSANEFNDAIDKIKATGQGVFNTIGAEIAKELIPEIEDVRNKLNKFIKSADFKKFKTQAVDTIKNFVKIGKNIAEAVLPKIASAVKFVADNFDKLVPSIYAAVTVFASLKAALAIAATINAFKTATLAAKAATDAATISQAGWNAVMAANPIGAVVTAVGLLAAGIGLLITSQNDASDSTDNLNTSTDESTSAYDTLIDKLKDTTDAYNKTKDAANEIASQESANIDYTKNLWAELQTLSDENGKVKEGYEARANFITNELSKALGIEIEMIDGQIQNYQELKDNIDSVIESKKAQILLEAYEEQYRDAVMNVTEAENARAKAAQEVARRNKELEDAQNSLTKATEEAEYEILGGTKLITQASKDAIDEAQKAVDARKEALDEATEAYDLSNQQIQTYYKDISSYEEASTAVLQGETDKAIKILEQYNGGLKTVSSTAEMSASDQKKILQQQVIDTEVNLKLMEADYEKYSAQMTEAEKAQAEQRIENARLQAKQAKEEFAAVGGNITKGIAEGAEDEGWVLNRSMQNLVERALNAAKQAAGIRSPSRIFRKIVGQMIGKGVARGVEDSTEEVIVSIKKQVAAVKKMVQQELNAVRATQNGQSSDSVASIARAVITRKEIVSKRANELSREELIASHGQSTITSENAGVLRGEIVQDNGGLFVLTQDENGVLRREPKYAEDHATWSTVERAKEELEKTQNAITKTAESLKDTAQAIVVISGVGKTVAQEFSKEVGRTAIDLAHTTAEELKERNATLKAALDARKGTTTETASESKNITVNQYNTYSQAHSRYEIYKSKQQAYNAVRLATATN